MKRINRTLYNKAKDLLKQGYNFKETAESIGVDSKTVSRWAKRMETEKDEKDEKKDIFFSLQKRIVDLEKRITKLEG